MPIYEYMENDDTQTEKKGPEVRSEPTDHIASTKKPSTTIPLMITIIGIFCYLGVVLPSVFKSSTGFFNYTAIDVLIMIGGAGLVGLGVYFWYKVRAKVFPEDEKKALELA